MNFFTRIALGAAIMAGAVTMNAQNRQDLLWMAGDALSYGWDLDKATALVATPDNAKVYTGTIHLEAGKDFKFLTTYDYGNPEIHPVDANATPDADGKVALMADGDDNKIHVAETANYFITVDTEAMEATIVKSEYQTTAIPFCALFMVGSTFESNYDCNQGHILYQDKSRPYVFSVKDQPMLKGIFKINWAIKGAGTWNKDYWYFRDSDDATKMVLAADGDNQWEVTEGGDYDVTADILSNTISIATSQAGVETIEAATEAGETVYYNLQGVRLSAPAEGEIVIRVAAGKATKMIF